MFADRAAPRPISQITGILRNAFGWWTGELAGLVPAALRRRLGSMRGQLYLMLDGERMDLIYDAAGRREVLARLPRPEADRDSARRALSALRYRRREAAAPVTLCIPADDALRHTITLPQAAAGNLAQVVSFELDRQTPFNREDIYFSHRLVKRDPEARQLLVELTVVPRAVVSNALQIATDLGLQVEAVRVSGEEGSTEASPNVLPEAARRKTPRLAGRALAGLAGLTVLLGIAALAIPFYQVEKEADELTQEVAQAKQKADASLRLQHEIDAAVQDRGSLVERKRQTVPVSDVLRNLTELLPDDTWLITLEISGTEVRLSGYSTSATEILRILDRSTAFSNAAFRASLTQDARLNREQFNIVAQVHGEKPR